MPRSEAPKSGSLSRYPVRAHSSVNAEASKNMPTPARYSLTSMHDPRLGRIFSGRRKATVFGVGREFFLLSVAALFYLNYHFIEVQIQINELPSLIFFVR